MAGSAGSAIKGSRVGAGPSGEAERGDAAPRVTVTYYCQNDHTVSPSFAYHEDLEIPEAWDCPKCGVVAGQDKNNVPQTQDATPFKTHMDYVRERRTDEEGKVLLEEALANLRKRRGTA